MARLSHCIALPYCLQYLGANNSEKCLMWTVRLGWWSEGMQEFFLGSRCAVLKRTCALGPRNGYFGGYVGKRQPACALETKKCVDKCFPLRGKVAGKS